jgi:hypothetical protein
LHFFELRFGAGCSLSIAFVFGFVSLNLQFLLFAGLHSRLQCNMMVDHFAAHFASDDIMGLLEAVALFAQ